MNKFLVSINDLPSSGKEFLLDDQEVWNEPLKEFKMDCRIAKPLKSRIFVMPAEGGCLVRGDLSGEVVMPCNRCTEDATIKIDTHFDEFEEIPQHHNKKDQTEEAHIIFERNAPMLNLAEVAWEQFMLALPPQPLCKNDCKGLCPECGTNLNTDSCSCEKQGEDPRMSVLRNLTINKK